MASTPTKPTPQSSTRTPVGTRHVASASGGLSANIDYPFLVLYLAAISAFGSFVNDMYLPSLPSMCRYFNCSVPMVQLGLTTGMIGLGVGEVMLGPLSDKYGRKPVLVWSMVLFCLAAVASVFSPSIHIFLMWRFVQGIGASGAYFLARTIPADIYGGRTLAKTMAVVGAINGFAPAAAPVLGGIVADHYDWKGVFVCLTIFAVLLLLFSRRLKETLPETLRQRGSIWRSFASYRKLLANKRFMAHTLLKAAALGLLFAYISSAPFIMQTHFGYTQTQFGLFMGGNALFVGLGSMVALRFRILKRAAFVGSLGLAVTIAALCCVLFLVDNFWAYELLLLPLTFCLGMIFTVTNTLAMNEGRADAGAASAVIGIAGYIFGAIVSPLVGQGNIMHSTAIVFAVLTAIILAGAFMTRAIPADLDNPPHQ